MPASTPRLSRRFLGFRLAEADIRLIRIFCAVAASNGFAAAQSELQMSPSAISRAVTGLELRLGVSLCKRGRGGFRLTEEGQHLLDLGQDLLRYLDGFERDMRSLNRHATGKLRLAMVDGLVADPARTVERLLARFHRDYPGVDIDLEICRPDHAENGLMDGRFDAAIVFRRSRSTEFRRIPLFEEISNLYCAADHPLARGGAGIADLSRHDYAGYGYASGLAGVPAQAAHAQLRRTATTAGAEAQALLIAGGGYFGYLPDSCVAATPALAGAVRLFPEAFEIRASIDLIVPLSTPSAAAQALADLADPHAPHRN